MPITPLAGKAAESNAECDGLSEGDCAEEPEDPAHEARNLAPAEQGHASDDEQGANECLDRREASAFVAPHASSPVPQ
jgi:hypothetical protein